MTGIRMFQLLEPLVEGKSARARLLNWNGERYRPSAFAAIYVHDVMGEQGERGDCGYCFLSEESHRWEVLGVMAGRARREAPSEVPRFVEESPALVSKTPCAPMLESTTSRDWPVLKGL